MQNLHVIGHIDRPKAIKTKDYHNPQYKGIVFNAFKKHLTSEEIEQVVTGYRRSTWSDEAFASNLEYINVSEHKVIKDEHYESALSEMNRRFSPKSKLKPVHYADLRLYPWRLSTNVGAPYNISEKWIQHINAKFNSGLIDNNRMSKHNLYNEFFVNNRYLFHRIKDGHTTDGYDNDLKYWNTAFARLHLVHRDDPDKVRLVFGAPTLLLQAEMAFIWPIQVSLLNRGIHSSPMLWGYETITGGWNRLNTWFTHHHPRLTTYFAFDWSRFDQQARHTVIDDIHEVWRTWFDFSSGYCPTTIYPETNPEPERLENLWQWMCSAVKKTPLLLPNGDLVEFRHSGIFSGFLQTQILDSCYNMVMIFTVLSRMGYDLSKIALKVEGDDSIGGILNTIPPYLYQSFLETFASYAKDYFGSTLNEKKSEISHTLEGMTVLKYRNHGCVPIRRWDELLAMLYHPERSQALPNLMARAVGIAYANCGMSTKVYRICEDIFNYLRALDISPNPKGLPGIFQFDEFFRPSAIPDDETGFAPIPIRKEIKSLLDIDLSHFPTYFETIHLLMNDDRTLLTDRHWLSTFFLEIPL
ncbi:RNA-dependent RNA polymerase [Polygonatum partitivirus 1]|uniref:RNA-dependent RNA polymerase n=1 Tax=Polygonatum kingianum cryptic virus 1 TaxID=2934243 RepID=A0A9Y1G594_9VIRU|nr:RNA-dependent RNA polymerase [Polygonatum kingianum cryptic virus 1]UZA97452.1 RNA-dependent RNA polymerase [Polygonatum partitivirus 1]